MIKMLIKEKRTEQRMSQMELSKKSGVSFSFISEVENGIKNITVNKLCLLAHALNVDPSELYEFKGGLR